MFKFKFHPDTPPRTRLCFAGFSLVRDLIRGFSARTKPFSRGFALYKHDFAGFLPCTRSVSRVFHVVRDESCRLTHSIDSVLQNRLFITHISYHCHIYIAQTHFIHYINRSRPHIYHQSNKQSISQSSSQSIDQSIIQSITNELKFRRNRCRFGSNACCQHATIKSTIKLAINPSC